MFFIEVKLKVNLLDALKVLFPRKIQLDKPGMDTAITTKKSSV